MKLLVTGGAGYIGSHTALQLIEAGHEIVILDNLYSGHRWAVPKEALFVEGDVGTPSLESLLREHKFDGVLHFAAHIEVGESVVEPAKYYRNNTFSALNLFEACRRVGVANVIFSSTAAVYGEPDVELIDENQPLRPINPYGASKMMSERILADIAAASGGAMNAVILRYFNAAGARPDLKVGQATPRSTHLVKIAAECALGLRPSMSIYGTDYKTPDGTCLRDYIHVDDLAQAHVKALEYLGAGGATLGATGESVSIFNVGYGKLYSVREVIETMKKVTGVDFKVVESPRRAGDSAVLGADSSKIRRVLKWQPRHESLELICQTAFDWEKKLRAGFPE